MWQIILFIVVPALVLWLCKYIRIFNWLGAIVVNYIIGIILTNFGIVNFDKDITETVAFVAVPFSIVLMLASSDLNLFFKNSSKVIFSFVLGLLSVMLISVFTTFLMKGKVKEIEIVAAMMVGCYSGGVANMASIGEALSVSSETFGVLSLYDVILGGAYLLFIFTIAKKFFELILPKYQQTSKEEKNFTSEQNKLESLYTKTKILEIFKSLLLGTVLTGLSVGISFLFYQKVDAPTIIISLTILGTLISLNPQIHSMPANFPTGDYFLLSFGLAMGALSDFQNFSMESLNTFIFMAIVLYGSIAIHLFFSKLFKIDTDTFIITSSAAIMSPPFIPAIATAIGNRQIILAGLSTGIMGMALGNLLGLLIFKLLTIVL